MASTSERMLRLLSLLQNHRFWPGAELAARLEVSDRTLRRDIDRLRGLGYPVDGTTGTAGGYQLRSGAAMPPLLLDDDEAVAIAVGLCTAATGSLAEVDEISVRALTKVVQVMPPRLRRRVDALQAYIVPPSGSGAETVDAGALATLAQAARDSERVRFEYRDGKGMVRTRLVEPHWLVPYARRWYLVAWDDDRADWRTFRVDRLSDPRTTGSRFRARDLPDGHDAPGYVRAARGSAPRTYRIVVRLEAPAEVVERIVGPWAEVERLAGESGGESSGGASACRLRMNADDFAWPTALLAMIGAEFRVEGPEEFREHLGRTLGIFRRALADDN